MRLSRMGKGAFAPCPPLLRCGGHAEFIIGRAFARPVGFAHPTILLIAILHFDTEALVSAARRPFLMSTNDLRALAEQSNAWPFEQAKQIVARLKKKSKDEVLFETGYGPSGLPHIGTFGEVARTTMVRHAFRVLTE